MAVSFTVLAVNIIWSDLITSQSQTGHVPSSIVKVSSVASVERDMDLLSTHSASSVFLVEMSLSGLLPHSMSSLLMVH